MDFYINFWNQIRIITQKLNDDNCQEEWKKQLQQKHDMEVLKRRAEA